ncbi:uncharacterized protein A1O9_06926 [Exophiala aquamarina CBS 119918]|uniref:Cyclohexanone monooxygenase n=1 Tax=Exophiala aquamarina CBS 119918 TaxID=1182545 RepID=A0A072PA59_9EURO|nr:uncharacterized protein A1O9_06926 [Exophiala aquamarina CBS 119918]KEF56736.1 hypothetical protein A1O9_06926 [Exophiala aquamarina CBS 119918]
MGSIANNVKGTNESTSKPRAFEYPPAPYQVLDQYHSKPCKIRVACIGAGATGLCTAYKMERMLEKNSWELTLFEKNDHFGGTWYENTYPGVACDIPSPLYTFSFDPNPNWSHYFAYGPEIQEYFEGFARRYDLEKYMKTNTKVVEVSWDQNLGVWNITLEDQTTKKTWYDWAHVLINGTGILNTWKWPEVKGLFDFKWPMMHSARWDHSVSFKGKAVGVIGTGSTSVQIIPVLQKVANKVDVFMRSPTWISPPFGATALAQLRKGVEPPPGQRQYKFTEEDKKRFRDDPEYFLRFRKEIEAEINSLFEMYISRSDVQVQFRDVIEKEMLRRLGPGNEKLKEFIIPKWSVGCRRVSPADGYLEALASENVTPVFGEIERVTENGLVVGGEERKVDILICATGFTPAFKPAFKVFNGKKTLSEDWGDSCNMYLGVAAPRFPNYFTIVGPGATWSNGTLIPGIETSVEYSIKMIKKIQTEGLLSVAVKQEALDDIYEHFDAFHQDTVWSEECRSWFKDGKTKRRIYLWPGPTIHFLKTIKDPRIEDYDIVYRYRNRFAFLGNGTVKASVTKDVLGLSPYVRNSDHPWAIE